MVDLGVHLSTTLCVSSLPISTVVVCGSKTSFFSSEKLRLIQLKFAMAGISPNVSPKKSVSPPPAVDWRKNCPGVSEKLKHLLLNEQLMDVAFLVGGETEDAEVINAHKFMLTMFSSVFEAMFMGEFVENSVSTSDPIKLPDVKPLAFKTMLTFIYLGEMDKTLSATGVLKTLYAAKKYHITELEIECLQLLMQQISEDNAVTVLQAAQMFDEKELKDKAYLYLRRNFDIVMKENDFLSITKKNLLLMLEDNDTYGSELSIWHGVCRWAKSECCRRKTDPTPENLRLEMQDALPLIRFPVIPSEDIAMEVVPAGILTFEECTLLLQHKVAETPGSRSLLPHLPYNDQMRSCWVEYTAVFYDEISGGHVDIPPGHSNRFTVDHEIAVISLGLYGPYVVDSSKYNVEINLRKDEESAPVIAAASYKGIIMKKREVFHVKFTHPVPVQPHIPYKAWFSIMGGKTCRGIPRGDVKKIEVEVPVDLPCESVKFTYVVTGVTQLPEIKFHVLN